MEQKFGQYTNTVLARGYGVLGKIVMQDKELHIYAKALYAYLVTFGNVAFPGKDKICNDLGIGHNTLNKYMAMLIKNGYISIIHSRSENGKFTKNTYVIESVKKIKNK